MRTSKYFILAGAVLVFAGCANAQQLDREEPQPPLTPRAAAQIDLTGQWVSVITQDWLYRMATPPRGDQGSIPLNKTGTQLANEWAPTAEVESCKAYGAAILTRRPGRLRISWEDESTLRIDAEAGAQSRLLHFAEFLAPTGFGTSDPPLALLRFQPAVPARLQGYSIAAWKLVAQIKGLSVVGMTSTPAPTPGGAGALMAVTTRMQAGYLQRNGIPYSADAVLTEFFNRIRLPNGEDFLIVTSIVEDPVYLTEPYMTISQFKHERDGARWVPSACNPS